ncbi:MAG: N-acetyltransferase family protein [Variibacter sp.]
MSESTTAPLSLRDARRDEVPAIVAMLADDILGGAREKAGDLPPYFAAFDAIAHDPNNRLLVANVDGALSGCLQLTFIPGLSRGGAWRAQIESVRIAASARGGGFGRRMIEAAIDLARARGCTLIQLTTDKARADALRFYENLGFAATHEGMKLMLD